MEHLEFLERVVPHLPSSPPPRMIFKNWTYGGRPTKEAVGVLALGTVVIIDGFQAKDESMRANGRRMTLTNGETLFMGSSGTGAPDDGADPTARRR